MRKKISQLVYNHNKQEPIPSLEHGDMRLTRYGENYFKLWKAEFIKQYGDQELVWDSHWGWQCIDKHSAFYAWQNNYIYRKGQVLDGWNNHE